MAFSKLDALQVLRAAFSDSLDALKVTSGTGNSAVTTYRRDYSSASVGTGSWVEIVSSLASSVTQLEIFDSSGQTLELGTGSLGNEARKILIFPGGNGEVSLAIASGSRVCLRAVSATANAGEIDINFFGAS